MCMVSAVTGAGMVQFPSPTQWTRDTWAEYNEILKRLKDLDDKLGAKDCEDPAKAAWMREVEKRLAQLENG